ncbi:hypothetical protein BU24DRAFT_41770 [Aaosphaeria arxii CBS 175.79]|uniref:Uncharacterized protein n=1 Tax=Aaosphaeria arxii CBS 175.79 TaxID=1450172 RepID=A0A6A5YC59_9PLEO|nr:uncharacterized protein BU24DRAFT_41770 [Aaosphaeria arxii CBS 175.79]KAF2022280.1 hypothetical protein BU24DRAFT_41770 [Aaosphaeria arxii CBS 175.79]
MLRHCRAHDDSAGFLESALRPLEVVVLGSAPFGVRSTVSRRSDFKAEVDRSGLSRRGWVLQEPFPSSRTQHLTAKSMFFEDERGVAMEEDAFDDVVSSFGALSPLPGPTLPMLRSPLAIPVAIGDGSSTALQTRGERALAIRTS